MAYDEDLDLRASTIITKWQNTSRKKMFGGVCYLINGNMLGGVYKNYLIVRLGEEGHRKALKKQYVRPFDITGRAMKGWVMVEPEGYADTKLAKWLEVARAFVVSLPGKG